MNTKRITFAAATAAATVLLAFQAYSPAAADPAPTSQDAFTTCMRSHGVQDFPGVTMKEDGQIQLKEGASVNVFSEAYRAAAKACGDKLPTDFTLPEPPSPPAIDLPAIGDGPTPPKAPGLPS